MSDLPRIVMAAGAMINSALYLAGCFVAGLALGNGIAWRMAIATAGINYLAYFLQGLCADQRIGWVFVVASIVAGLIGGVALLW